METDRILYRETMSKRTIPVVQYTPEREPIREVESIPDAIEATSISGKTIRNCYKGGYYCFFGGYVINIYSVGGYKWMFKDAS